MNQIQRVNSKKRQKLKFSGSVATVQIEKIIFHISVPKSETYFTKITSANCFENINIPVSIALLKMSCCRGSCAAFEAGDIFGKQKL